jgi:hypothetical protein
MFSGCLLFSDKFHDGNGWGKLFRDGENYVLYEGPTDLLELYNFYVNQPELANTIAQNGRRICEQNFLLSPSSCSWLLEVTAEALRSRLAFSTMFLENNSSPPIDWQSTQALGCDLSIYEILQDLCVCFYSVLFIPSRRDSAPLLRAIVEQLARCCVTPLFNTFSLAGAPVVMTRIPHRYELINFLQSTNPYLLVLLRLEELSAQGISGAFDTLLDGLDVVRRRKLGDSLHRKDLGILHVSPFTAHAEWPLPSGWQAHLIYTDNSFARLAPLYPQGLSEV